MIQRLLRCAATAAMILSVFACGSKEAKATDPEKPDLQEPMELVLTGAILDYREPVVYVSDFGLHAWADGNSLILSARNRGSATIDVLHNDLALIFGPSKRDMMTINASNSDVRNFVPMRLSPGQRAVSRLTITAPFENLRGLRLVYNNPRNNIMTYTEVQ